MLICMWVHRYFACMNTCVCSLPGIPPVAFMVHLIPMSTKNEQFHQSHLIKPVLGKSVLFCLRKGSGNQVYFSAQLLTSPCSQGMGTVGSVYHQTLFSSLEPVFYTYEIHFPPNFLFCKNSNTEKLKE